MLTDEDRKQQQADREAVRAWWAGDQSRPLMLPLHPAYCACNLLLPTVISRIGLILRFVAFAIVERIPSSACKVFLYRRMGVRIGRRVYIAPRVVLDPVCPRLIELEDDCLLGAGCRLLVHEHTARYFRVGRVRVGAGSVVGAWSIVRGGVTIGRGVTTGLGCVVLKDVPDGQTVIGNPARRVRAVEQEEAAQWDS